MLIRQATQKDLGSIATIENSVSSPWTKSQIAAELDYAKAAVLAAVSEQTGMVTGWCCLRFNAPEAELLKIAVSPDHKRKGVGTLLLKEALKTTFSAGCEELFLEVRSKNLSARTFYRQFGFHELGTRKSYYVNPVDDAVLYRRKLVPGLSENF